MNAPTGLFLRGGRVIDPARGIDARLDVLVRDGRIAELRPPDAPTPVEEGIDVRDITGCVVTPGLVDLHGHWYDGSAYGIDPAVSLRSGVTTAVDAGTAGFVNFASFRRQSIDSAPLRVLAFLNIAALGIPTTLSGELDTPDHIRPGETAETIRAHADVAVGVKVRLSAAVETGGAPAALDRALEAARAVDRPVMVDVGGPGDFMPDALDRLGPGDILTHCFTGGGATIIDDAGRVRREAIDARARGVIFDVGHGCGSFSWRSARAALGQGFAPDSISSDLHRYSVDRAGVDLNTMMTKFLALASIWPMSSPGSPSRRRARSACRSRRCTRRGRRHRGLPCRRRRGLAERLPGRGRNRPAKRRACADGRRRPADRSGVGQDLAAALPRDRRHDDLRRRPSGVIGAVQHGRRCSSIVR